MADARLRVLERTARADPGDVGALERWDAEHTRCGSLSPPRRDALARLLRALHHRTRCPGCGEEAHQGHGAFDGWLDPEREPLGIIWGEALEHEGCLDGVRQPGESEARLLRDSNCIMVWTHEDGWLELVAAGVQERPDGSIVAELSPSSPALGHLARWCRCDPPRLESARIHERWMCQRCGLEVDRWQGGSPVSAPGQRPGWPGGGTGPSR